MGTSFENGARSKKAEKKLGRERRRVVLKKWFSKGNLQQILVLEYQLTIGKILVENC